MGAGVNNMSVDNCSPFILHWHLRKCGGTDVRHSMHNYANYDEAHTEYVNLVKHEETLVRRSNNCSGGGGVRRLALLRHPYSQMLSEMQHFPEAYMLLGKNRTVLALQPNRFVCSHHANMGLCPDGTGCNASAVLAVLARFDYLSIVSFRAHSFAAFRFCFFIFFSYFFLFSSKPRSRVCFAAILNSLRSFRESR